MSLWRKEAFERFPELRKILQEEKNPYCFMHKLMFHLLDAYQRKDVELIRRIYAYAIFCLEAPRGKDSSNDLPTIITVSFFEDLPWHEIIRRDLGQYFPRTFIEDMKEVFLYLGTEEQYQEILDSCTVHRFKKKRG